MNPGVMLIPILLLFAYLLGSIPFSQLITSWRMSLNLREVGEGNVGSRNVWHVVGPEWGLAAFALDAFKGIGALEGARAARAPEALALLCGVGALLGHHLPSFLRSHGGKGLATALGALLVVTPLSRVGGLAVLGLVYLLTRAFNPRVAGALLPPRVLALRAG